jgi:hypothetical protein
MCLEELVFWYKYIPLAIDVSDQNVFLSQYNFLRQEILLGEGKCLHGSFLAFAFMFGAKI